MRTSGMTVHESAASVITVPLTREKDPGGRRGGCGACFECVSEGIDGFAKFHWQRDPLAIGGFYPPS
jgi:hypothetical protein